MSKRERKRISPSKMEWEIEIVRKLKAKVDDVFDDTLTELLAERQKQLKEESIEHK